MKHLLVGGKYDGEVVDVHPTYEPIRCIQKMDMPPAGCLPSTDFAVGIKVLDYLPVKVHYHLGHPKQHPWNWARWESTIYVLKGVELPERELHSDITRALFTHNLWHRVYF